MTKTALYTGGIIGVTSYVVASNTQQPRFQQYYLILVGSSLEDLASHLPHPLPFHVANRLSTYLPT